MSDIFKAGLYVDETVVGSDAHGAEKGSSAIDSPDVDEVRKMTARFDELYAAGETGRLGSLLDEKMKQYAGKPAMLGAVAAWLFQDQRAIHDEAVYRSAEACAEALSGALKGTGNLSIAADVKTNLRALKRQNERSRAVLAGDKQTQAYELSSSSARAAELREEVSEAESRVEALRREKSAAEHSLNNAPRSSRFDSGGSAGAGATVGGLILAIYAVATFNWSQYAAILYFILVIPFAAVIGAGVGAVAGLVVGGIWFNHNSSKVQRDEAVGKMAVAEAEKALTEAVGKKEVLDERFGALSIRINELVSDDETDKELALAESYVTRADSLIGKLG